MPQQPPVRPIRFGNAKTQKERQAEHREQLAKRPKRPGTLEHLRAYVLVHQEGQTSPCPDLERAKAYAHEHGTHATPVIVTQRGTELYCWPERRAR